MFVRVPNGLLKAIMIFLRDQGTESKKLNYETDQLSIANAGTK